MLKKGFLDIFNLSRGDHETKIIDPIVSGDVSEKREPIEYNQEELTEIGDYCRDKCQEIIRLAGFDSEVRIQKVEAGYVSIEVTRTEDAGRIIGKSGQTIDALQLLLKSMAYKKFKKPIRLNIDVENYKRNRIEGLKRTALSIADSLNSAMPRKELEPMTAQERREIHVLFQDRKGVHSYSKGDGSDRHIVLELLQQ